MKVSWTVPFIPSSAAKRKTIVQGSFTFWRRSGDGRPRRRRTSARLALSGLSGGHTVYLAITQLEGSAAFGRCSIGACYRHWQAWAVGAHEGFHQHFIAVPCADAHIAIAVLDGDTAAAFKSVGLAGQPSSIARGGLFFQPTLL